MVAVVCYIDVHKCHKYFVTFDSTIKVAVHYHFGVNKQIRRKNYSCNFPINKYKRKCKKRGSPQGVHHSNNFCLQARYTNVYGILKLEDKNFRVNRICIVTKYLFQDSYAKYKGKYGNFTEEKPVKHHLTK